MDLGIWAAAVGLLLFVPAAALLAWTALHSLRARRWPTADGQIVDCRTTFPTHNRLQGRVEVRYTYRVGAERHEAARVRFGDWLIYSAPAARAIAQRYPKGRRVAVRYNPRHPADATLEASATTLLYLWLGLLLFAIVALANALAQALART